MPPLKKILSNSEGDCKCSKNTGPSPLRSVVPYPSNQAQTIEFVKRVRNKSKCNTTQGLGLWLKSPDLGDFFNN